MTRRILTDFVIDKIAAVDKPCQEGARATIMKRAPVASVIKSADDIRKALASFADAPDRAALKRDLVERARALDALNALPESWLTKFDIGAFADKIAKDFFVVMPPLEEDEDEPESFDEAFDEVMDQRAEWAAWSDLDPYFDALRRSLQSICADRTTQGVDRLLAIRNSVGQFLDAVQTKYSSAPEVVAATSDAASATTSYALKSLAMLRTSVLKVKTNEMLESLKGRGGGTMPTEVRVHRNSQPMVRAGSQDLDGDLHDDPTLTGKGPRARSADAVYKSLDDLQKKVEKVLANKR